MFLTNLEMWYLMDIQKIQKLSITLLINLRHIEHIPEVVVMIMAFSWKQAKKDVIVKKIERAITLAKVGTNPDFVIQHADWIRDAQKKDFTVLTKKIGDEVRKRQDQQQARYDKYAGK